MTSIPTPLNALNALVGLLGPACSWTYVKYLTYAWYVSENAAHELPITNARDQLAEVVNEAAYAGQITYLTRRGKRLAAIVSIETAEAAERWEDEHLGRLADAAQAEIHAGEPALPLSEVIRSLHE